MSNYGAFDDLLKQLDAKGELTPLYGKAADAIRTLFDGLKETDKRYWGLDALLEKSTAHLKIVEDSNAELKAKYADLVMHFSRVHERIVREHYRIEKAPDAATNDAREFLKKLESGVAP